jgi:polyisoprenoid-binding protein YceI
MTRPLAALLALLASPAAALAADWSLVADRSTLSFASSYDGEAFSGRFARFEPTLSVDPADPAATRIVVDIDLTSANTGNEERDGTLATPDFFWTEKFPRARFATGTCRAGAAAGEIDCEATLTLRDRSLALPFRFQFAVAGTGATLKAKASVDRIAFGVGGGDWADTDLIPKDVEVTVDLVLAAH